MAIQGTPTFNSFTATAESAGQRLDKFLHAAMPEFSRSYFQNLIEARKVSINQAIAKSSSILKAGDTITLTLTPITSTPSFNPINTDLGIEIIFTHEHFFIIHKPANILVHQTQAANNEPTVVDWLLSQHADIKAVGDQERPGIVHRLDRETSGLLVIARTNYAHQLFGQMFKNRTISKSYLAVVEGHPEKSGIIDLAISRHPIHRKKMTTHANDYEGATKPFRAPTSGQRSALTNYTVKQYFKNHSLIQVYPKTGRTHQIRVHFAAIGHPLVGDFLYGNPSKIIGRHALHAQGIAFNFDGKDYNFSKEAPQDFKKLLDLLTTYE